MNTKGGGGGLIVDEVLPAFDSKSSGTTYLRPDKAPHPVAVPAVSKRAESAILALIGSFLKQPYEI